VWPGAGAPDSQNPGCSRDHAVTGEWLDGTRSSSGRSCLKRFEAGCERRVHLLQVQLQVVYVWCPMTLSIGLQNARRGSSDGWQGWRAQAAAARLAGRACAAWGCERQA
jgi:hypothetical protein